jgi:serine/threonine-protein kinase
MSVLHLYEGGQIPLNVGDVGTVELRELLGTGGFAAAWRVADVDTGKEYTLKVVQGLRPDGTMAHRVRLEAEVAIPSEYVVPVVGLREWDPSTFLILFDYFPAEPLDRLLERKALSAGQKKLIFTETLLGVADAHRHNVVHRDLKPGNILVTDGGHVRLIDFGVSKFKGRNLTLSGEILGTLPYMAPEVLGIGARVADARADIYSLGQVLYEMATGQHFWTRQGWSELRDLVGFLNRRPPPAELIDLEGFHCDFYRDAARVLRRMVKVDPDERHPSVEEVLADLGHVPDLPEPPPGLRLRSPLLIVESGSNRGARTVLGLADGERRELGRSDLAGNDESVSRRHLAFSRRGDRYYVEDLGSKNGTLLRGLALAGPAELRHADRIKVGDLFLRFAFLHPE